MIALAIVLTLPSWLGCQPTPGVIDMMATVKAARCAELERTIANSDHMFGVATATPPSLACPPGKVMVSGECRKADESMLLNYDPVKQGEVPFTLQEVIPASGKLKVVFPAEFVRVPGCLITGDEQQHIQILEQAKDHLLIRGHPGQKLKFDCNGLLNR